MKTSTVLLFAGIMSWIIAAFEGIRASGSWNVAAIWFIVGGILLLVGQNQRRREK